MTKHVHFASGRTLFRGARPSPRHVLAGAVPFRATVTPPPYYFIFPRKLSMWLNDQYGDCVTAEEAFNKACNGVFISDSTVQTWAGNNGLLNGADLQPVIQLMQADGFHQDGNIYGDGHELSIDYSNVATTQAAIYQAGTQGGCVKVSCAAEQLPSGAGNANGWFLTSDSPDNNQDHCTALCGYGTAQQFVDAINAAYGANISVPSGVDPTLQGYAMFTWSTIGFMSTKAMVNMVGEAWIRNPSSVNTGSGTPSSDSVYTTSAPTPVPTPTPTPIPDPGPTPTPGPTPQTCSITIPDQVIQVPHGIFGTVNVTIHGGTYTGTVSSASKGAISLTIPPFLLRLLHLVCSGAVVLPAPWNMLVGYLCTLLPANANALAASNQSATVSVPPWFLSILRFLCAEATYLPEPYKDIAVGLCGLLPAQGKNPCGGCN